MIKIAICDDTEMQIELLRDLLSEYRSRTKKDIQVYAYPSGEALLAAREEEGPFDIYILDIIMDNLNGIETATALREKNDNGKLLFLTVSVDYVFSAFSVRAANYLLKPINPKKLFSELDLLVKEIEQEQPSVVMVRTAKGEQRLLADDIIYIDYLDRRPVFHLVNDEIVEGFSQRQKFQNYLAEILSDDHFERCHISMAVNLRHVISLKGDKLYLEDGTELLCTRTMRPNFRKKLQEYQQR